MANEARLVSVEDATQVVDQDQNSPSASLGHAVSFSPREAAGDLEDTLSEIAGDVAQAWQDALPEG